MTRRDDSHLDTATLEQLAVLLSLASRPATPGESLPAGLPDLAECRRRLSGIPAAGFGTADRLLDAVCEPCSSADAFVRIRQLTQELLLRGVTKEQHDALTLVYHAAAAAAFALFGVQITNRPIEQRLALYESLAAALRETPLGSLFLRAVDRAESQGLADAPDAG